MNNNDDKYELDPVESIFDDLFPEATPREEYDFFEATFKKENQKNIGYIMDGLEVCVHGLRTIDNAWHFYVIRDFSYSNDVLSYRNKIEDLYNCTFSVNALRTWDLGKRNVVRETGYTFRVQFLENRNYFDLSINRESLPEALECFKLLFKLYIDTTKPHAHHYKQ